MKEIPNLNYLAQFSRGDKSFEEKMISIVKSEFPNEIEVYHAHLEEKSYKLASDNVHKIKHKISLFGLEKSHVVATNHENNLREGDITLASEFEDILKIVTDYLETL